MVWSVSLGTEAELFPHGAGGPDGSGTASWSWSWSLLSEVESDVETPSVSTATFSRDTLKSHDAQHQQKSMSLRQGHTL